MSWLDLDTVFEGRAGPGLHQVQATAPEDLAEAAAGHGWVPIVAEVTGVADKGGLLAALAAAGRFPDWVGGNWDALQDAIGDLSWLGPADGYLVVLVGWAGLAPGLDADRLVAESVFAAAAAEWADRGTPFVTLVA